KGLSTAELANLAVNMDVTGPGIASGTYIQSIEPSGTITLSAQAAASISGTLSVYTSQFTFPAAVTSGSAVISGIDTTRLVAGMAVQDPTDKFIPDNTTIASIDYQNQKLTLSAQATSGSKSPVVLTFTGQNLKFLTQKATDTSYFYNVSVQDTSQLTSGM